MSCSWKDLDVKLRHERVEPCRNFLDVTECISATTEKQSGHSQSLQFLVGVDGKDTHPDTKVAQQYGSHFFNTLRHPLVGIQHLHHPFDTPPARQRITERTEDKRHPIRDDTTGTDEHQLFYTVRFRDRILECNPGTLRHTNQNSSFYLQGVQHVIEPLGVGRTIPGGTVRCTLSSLAEKINRVGAIVAAVCDDISRPNCGICSCSVQQHKRW